MIHSRGNGGHFVAFHHLPINDFDQTDHTSAHICPAISGIEVLKQKLEVRSHSAVLKVGHFHVSGSILRVQIKCLRVQHAKALHMF